MGKSSKKSKVQSNETEEKKSGYVSKYFKDCTWLNTFDEGIHQLTYKDEIINAQQLMHKVLDAWKSASDQFNVAFYIEDGWGVEYAVEKQAETSFYQLTDIFVRIWTDNVIDRMAETLYLRMYRHVLKDMSIPNNKREKQADERALQYQNAFLTKVA